MKLDNIKDYYLGNKAYNLFLLGLIDNKSALLNHISNKRYINAAKMGFIANIFTGIKEDLVKKTDEGYKNILIDEVLKENVSIIANKSSDGFVIDGYSFKDEATLISKLRNKIAHGLYSFDFDHNRVIIDMEGGKIILNIDKLALFIVSSSNTFLKYSLNNPVERVIGFNEKVIGNRTKPITNKNELIGFIRKCKIARIIINDDSDNVYYDNKNISMILEKYKSNLSVRALNECKKSIENNRNLKWDIRKYSDKNISLLADFLLKICSDNVDYMSQVNIILRELVRKSSMEYNRRDIIINNVINLIILDIIYKYNSLDKKSLLFYLDRSGYEFVSVDHFTLVSSGIAMFNSLFSYAMDDIYKRNVDSVNLDDAFDYSMLDLSKVNVCVNVENKGYINELIIRRDAMYKDILVYENKIKELSNNINNINNNNKVHDLLSDKKNLLQSKKNDLESDLDNINKILDSYSDTYKYNESIIRGIRNSIAHGSYYVVHGTNFKDCKIIFEDYDNDNLVFKANIAIIDFFKLIDSASLTVFDFIEEVKVKKLEINK